MPKKKIPFAHFYSWKNVPDSMIPNIMAEFSWHGVENLVFADVWLTRIIREPLFAATLRRMAFNNKINLIEAHGPWGADFDLCCTEKSRVPGLINDHILAMNYAAESGSRTYTIHIGAYASVFYQTPNSVLRPLALAVLEKLLPAAEKLGLILAVENSYERSNTPDEVLYYIDSFKSPWIQCCFDAGHANIMAPYPEKKRELYSGALDEAWAGNVEEYSGAFERLAPHIVTCHLHDNNSYGDQHNLPGTGTVNWPELVKKLMTAPNLRSMQSESMTHGIPVAKLVKTFRDICPIA